MFYYLLQRETSHITFPKLAATNSPLIVLSLDITHTFDMSEQHQYVKMNTSHTDELTFL